MKVQSCSNSFAALTNLVAISVSLMIGSFAYSQDAEVPVDPEQERLEALVAEQQQILDGFNGNFSLQGTEYQIVLADALRQLGRYNEAGVALDNALQSVRISNGLYSVEQLPILELLIENAIQEGDWPKVDSHFYLSMDIAERSLTPDEPRFEELVRRFSSWKMQVYRNDLIIDNNAMSSQDAVAYYQLLLDGLDVSEPDYLTRRIQYTRELAMARYYAAMAVSEMSNEEFTAIGPETMTTETCVTVLEDTGSGPQAVSVCESNHVPNPTYFESRQKHKFDLLEAHINWIRRNYLDLITELEADPATDPVQLAQVVMSLGDMNFLLNATVRANTQYARAYQILNENNVAPEIQMQLMGQPREISDAVIGSMGLPLVSRHDKPTGLVSFDVTPEGTIRNLGITGSGADLEAANQQLITTILRESVYRPALQSGKPVEARLEVPAENL